MASTARRSGSFRASGCWTSRCTDHDFVVRAICGNALLDRGECVDELLAAGAPKVRMRALTFLGPDAAWPTSPTVLRRSGRWRRRWCSRQAAIRRRTTARCRCPSARSPDSARRVRPRTPGLWSGTSSDERPRIRGVAVRGLRRVAPGVGGGPAVADGPVFRGDPPGGDVPARQARRCGSRCGNCWTRRIRSTPAGRPRRSCATATPGSACTRTSPCWATRTSAADAEQDLHAWPAPLGGRLHETTVPALASGDRGRLRSPSTRISPARSASRWPPRGITRDRGASP